MQDNLVVVGSKMYPREASSWAMGSRCGVENYLTPRELLGPTQNQRLNEHL